MKISETIFNAGVNDYKTDLFEGQYIVPNGMAYNSYVIIDEKTAVFDTVDARFGDEWLGNVKKYSARASPIIWSFYIWNPTIPQTLQTF